MERRIKHIWRYITSPLYRLHFDLMTSQETVNMLVEKMKQNIELSAMPPIKADHCLKYSEAYGISIMEAEQIIKITWKN